jgi:hypothetical protein
MLFQFIVLLPPQLRREYILILVKKIIKEGSTLR